MKHFPKNGRVVSPADMVQIMEFGKIRTDVLCEADTPPYMSIPLSEIDAIIMEYRLGRGILPTRLLQAGCKRPPRSRHRIVFRTRSSAPAGCQVP